MRRVRHLLAGDSGNVLFFAAVGMLTIGAMTILAVDISKLLVTRAQLQNSADGGALAGAELFLQTPIPDDASVKARAEDVAGLNRAFTNSNQEPVDRVADVTATVSHPNALNLGSGRVEVVSRSVVTQYFTDLVSLGRSGGVAARAVAEAGEVCKVSCLKPWSIPDRWADVGMPGYPLWAGNRKWDSEKFTDINGDGMWNPGEPWIEGGLPPDLQYTAEFYHPIITGYLASKDYGVQLTLKAGDPHGASAAGQYYPIDLPIPNEPDVGADRYRWNIGNCNPTAIGPGDRLWTENGNMKGPTGQGLRELIAQDPEAYWDPLCSCVKGSAFRVGESPRIAYIPLHDPRIPMDPGKMQLLVVKIVAFFIEDARANGDVVGRFMKVQSPNGELCADGATSGGYLYRVALIE